MQECLPRCSQPCPVGSQGPARAATDSMVCSRSTSLCSSALLCSSNSIAVNSEASVLVNSETRFSRVLSPMCTILMTSSLVIGKPAETSQSWNMIMSIKSHNQYYSNIYLGELHCSEDTCLLDEAMASRRLWSDAQAGKAEHGCCHRAWLMAWPMKLSIDKGYTVNVASDVQSGPTNPCRSPACLQPVPFHG